MEWLRRIIPGRSTSSHSEGEPSYQAVRVYSEASGTMGAYIVDKYFDPRMVSLETADIIRQVQTVERMSKQVKTIVLKKEVSVLDNLAHTADEAKRLVPKENEAFGELVLDVSPQQRRERETIHHLRLLGYTGLNSRALTEQYNIGRRHGRAEDLLSFYPLKELIESTNVLITLHGVSLKGLLDKSQSSKFAPADVYKFLIDVSLIRNPDDVNALLAEQTLPALKRNQNIAKAGIVDLNLQVNALINSPDELLRHEQNSRVGVARQAIGVVRELKDIGSRYRHKIFNTLLDPDSADFPAVAAAVESYIGESEEKTFFALFLAGLQDRDNIYTLYRQADEFQRQGIAPEFYAKITNAIRQYNEMLPVDLEIPTVSMIPLAKDIALEEIAVQAPSASDLKNIISGIFAQKGMRREYTLVPENIAWGDLVPAQHVAVSHKENPNIFDIDYTYYNQYGETVTITTSINVTKNMFDWKILEDAGVYPQLRNVFLAQSLYILQHVAEQARMPVTQPQQPVAEAKQSGKNKREHHRDDVYDLRKTLGNKPAIGSQGVNIGIGTKEAAQVSLKIVMPSGKELQALLSRLGTADQRRIIDKINALNITGEGRARFKKLHEAGRDGRPVYSFPAGSMRVLSQEKEGEKTPGQSFTPFDVDYRQGVYSRNNL